MSNAQRVIAGITYNLTQSMVRRKQKSLIQRLITTVAAIVLGLPIFAVVGPIWYLIMCNKQISQRAASILVPRVMPLMDYAFQDLKKELLKGLHGRVLDVGCGDGNWLRYFTKASFVTELEPNPHLIPQIERNVKLFKEENPQIEVEVMTKFASDLDPAKPYDYIVFGNVMCEVPDQHAFLRDIDAVLKPGGKVVFMEHIRHPPGTMAGFAQDVGNVWWSCASDGCHCNRHTVDSMRSVKGWNVEFWDLEQDGFGLLDRMALGIISKEQPVAEKDASDLVSRF